MSAHQLTKKLLRQLNHENVNYDLIVMNFANGDLVGHSGEFKAAVKAVETLDDCLSQIVPVALDKGYNIIIGADHGNCEYMKYPDGKDCPSHTLNPVNYIVLTEKGKSLKLLKGKNLGLCHVAPTILELMGIKQPKVMTGKSLIIK